MAIRTVMSSNGFRTDRRQQERFTTRIRNIIREYPWGLGVVKEFLANADDAGAKDFVIVFDKRHHTKVTNRLEPWYMPSHSPPPPHAHTHVRTHARTHPCNK